MSIYQILMPKLGESVVEGTISKIMVSEGDTIVEDDLLLEITTAKVDSEVPSPVAGTVTKIYCEEDQLLSAGTLLMDIRLEGEEDDEQEEVQETEVASTEQERPQDQTKRFLSPLVKKMMNEYGISLRDLEKVQGSGVGGRVQKADILNYLAKQEEVAPPTQKSHSESFKSVIENPSPKVQTPEPEVFTANGDYLEMGNTRKVIAQRMVESLSTSAHVTTVVQADVTSLVQWRKKTNPQVKEKHQVSISFLSVFVEVVTKALKRYPKLNSSIVGDRVLLKKDINIGFAAATEQDDLFVPVVKDCDELNIIGISKRVQKLIDKVRDGKLGIDEMTGGTFTLTNFGSFKGLFGTPIINQPEVAILALGNIEKVPAVIETELGDVIGIRHKMYLSLSHDHRIIDGMLAGKFLQAIVEEIESYNPNVI
ncbi:2-oxo acid dehydrogenase subunit E2 [Halosquirtibacter laminarini]|uniref:2-oxo acid dehydrogenase subunit E2 n=1 Tax=Halosquirtibacter laminarini TaxID=3374600 RepID=A0AC61NP85_9BACT|nr:2-oxo acid dehydrogenase subunit E2 [Prolixibacteraceae bacterium]